MSDANRALSRAIDRRGLLFVLSSPSGAGKTTLAHRLLAADDAIRLSISVTTRAPRSNEVEGRDYYFIDRAEFNRRAAAGELLEHAEVFGNGYGTPRQPVMEAVRQGRDVLFDIEWQGSRQLAAAMPGDLVRVFILPPDMKALEDRLRSRNQDAEAEVARRMAAATAEISHWGEYDYVIVNADLEVSVQKLRAILTAERQRRERLVGLADFVEGLLGGGHGQR